MRSILFDIGEESCVTELRCAQSKLYLRTGTTPSAIIAPPEFESGYQAECAAISSRIPGRHGDSCCIFGGIQGFHAVFEGIPVLVSDTVSSGQVMLVYGEDAAAAAAGGGGTVLSVQDFVELIGEEK